MRLSSPWVGSYPLRTNQSIFLFRLILSLPNRICERSAGHVAARRVGTNSLGV